VSDDELERIRDSRPEWNDFDDTDVGWAPRRTRHRVYFGLLIIAGLWGPRESFAVLAAIFVLVWLVNLGEQAIWLRRRRLTWRQRLERAQKKQAGSS
jgi:hypothetical protein